MMTVVTTLKQHRQVLGSMTDACQSAYTRLPAPSLRPRHPEAEEDFPVAAYPTHLNDYFQTSLTLQVIQESSDA
jgi:hypothetical protein